MKSDKQKRDTRKHYEANQYLGKQLEGIFIAVQFESEIRLDDFLHYLRRKL